MTKGQSEVGGDGPLSEAEAQGWVLVSGVSQADECSMEVLLWEIPIIPVKNTYKEKWTPLAATSLETSALLLPFCFVPPVCSDKDVRFGFKFTPLFHAWDMVQHC